MTASTSTAGEASRMKVRPSRSRAIFFTVDGEVFVNLLFNYSDVLDVDGNELERLLAAHDADDIVVGRRLTRAEAAMLAVGRGDIESEVFARIVPDKKDRWTGRRRRRRS